MGKTVTPVDLGTSPGDGTGTPARTWAGRLNEVITAIGVGFFTDVTGEIAALTNKATPVDADVGMMEDSAASNAKKKWTFANLATYVITKVRATVNAFTKQQYFGTATLTDGANISWNLDNAQVAEVALGGNRTLDNPTNMKDGGTYILRVEQDSTGSRTLAYGTAYKWTGGTAPTLTTAGGSVDVLTFISDGTNMYGVASLDFQ